jgi:cytochrome c-type biogenesis protein CcmH
VRRAALAFAVALFAAPVMAEPAPAPDQPLASSAQEARAQALFQDIRCVVCQHESIADSPAGIAADMRRLVREEIAAGSHRRSHPQRSGPPLGRLHTVQAAGEGRDLAAVVRTPDAGAVGGGRFIAALSFRKKPATAPLSPDEERRLEELLHAEGVRPDPAATSSHD